MVLFKRIKASIVAGVFLALPAHAAGTGGCESFEWPMATELAWMQAPDAKLIQSGDRVVDLPQSALEIALVPIATVKLAAAPSGKPKAMPETERGAVVVIDQPSTVGLHQITLSRAAWIDVIQGGEPLKAVAHTGKSDCEAIRKSVRFEIGPGPFTIQITGADAPTIKVIVRKAP